MRSAPADGWNDQKAEIGVFGAEKYYNMEMKDDVDLLFQRQHLGLSSKQPEIGAEAAEDQIVGTRISESSITAKEYYSCLKSRESVTCSCFLRTLCSNDQPKAIPSETGSTIIRSKKFCPDMKVSQITQKAAITHVTGVEEKGAPRSSDYDQLGVLVRKKADIEEGLEKRLSVLKWDAIPGSRKAVQVVKKVDGYESDESSELFEIESLSMSTRQSVSTSTRQGSAQSYAPTDSTDLGRNDKKLYPRMSGITIARVSPAGLLGCSGHKSTAVCGTLRPLNPNQ